MLFNVYFENMKQHSKEPFLGKNNYKKSVKDSTV